MYSANNNISEGFSGNAEHTKYALRSYEAAIRAEVHFKSAHYKLPKTTGFSKIGYSKKFRGTCGTQLVYALMDSGNWSLRFFHKAVRKQTKRSVFSRLGVC